MRFHFTEEDRTTFVRARDLRAALVHAGHRVSHAELGVPAPPETSWGELYRPAAPSGIGSTLRSAAARLWAKGF